MRSRILTTGLTLSMLGLGCVTSPRTSGPSRPPGALGDQVSVTIAPELLFALVGTNRPVLVDGILRPVAEARSIIASGRARDLEVIYATECPAGAVCAIVNIQTRSVSGL